LGTVALVRLFACTLLDPDHRSGYDQLVGEFVARHGPGLRPIPTDSAHLTYAFIARLDEVAVPQAAEAIRIAAEDLHPFEVTIGVPTLRAAGREARLIHAPVTEGAGRLAALADQVAEALTHALPRVAVSRTGSPHVTLARFGRGTTRQLAEPIAEEMARAATAQRQRVRRVQLISSELTRARPIYTVQAEIGIGPAGT